jgi:hypothetical protein
MEWEKKNNKKKEYYRQKIISGICPSSTFDPLFSPDAKNRNIIKWNLSTTKNLPYAKWNVTLPSRPQSWVIRRKPLIP